MAARLLALAAVLVAAGTALADKDPTPEPGGRPPGFEPGKPARFWVWHADGAWHIRTTTAKQRHKFEALIAVDEGHFTALSVPKADGFGPNSDKIAWNKDQTKIAFDFFTDGNLDGVDFEVGPKVKWLAFDLRVDGESAPKLVTIGKGGDQPASAQFVLPAHPKGK